MTLDDRQHKIANAVTKAIKWFDSPWKVYGAVALLLLSLFLAYYFRNKIDDGIEKIYQWRFSQKIAKQEQATKALEDENVKLLDQLKASYSKGEARELQIAMLNSELEKYGREAQKAVELQEKAQQEFENDQANISIDIPIRQRCLNLCAERQAIGYPCRLNYCERFK